MRMAGGGGGGGHFVGIDPGAARALAGAMSNTTGRALITGWRVGALLAAAGPDAAGATTVQTLGSLRAWLGDASTDLRWRIELLAADGAAVRNGMVTAYLPFASA